MLAGLTLWVAVATGAAAEEPLPVVLDIDLSLGFTARENEPKTGLDLDEDGDWELDQLLQPHEQQLYGSAALSLGVEWEATSWLLVQALVHSGELRPGAWLDPPLDGLTADGQTIGEGAADTAFVRVLSASLYLGPAVIELGRRRTTLASGLVYDDYGTGLFFTFEFEELDLAPWTVEVMALLVGDTVTAMTEPNPLFALRVTYEFALFESVSLLGALFWDRGTLHHLFASAVAERWIVDEPPLSLCQSVVDLYAASITVPDDACLAAGLDGLYFGERDSQGLIGYVGLSGNVIPIDGMSLRGAFVLNFGRVDVDVNLDAYSLAELTGSAAVEELMTQEITLGLLGWAGQLELHYGLGRWIDAFVARELDLDVGAFAFVISGADPSEVEGRYDAFVGVAPYWVYTGIFFSGGLSQSFNAGRTTAAGINGHGVFGGGPSLELSGEYGAVELRGAYLGAMAPRPDAGITYGFEIDLIGELELVDWLALEAEVDLLLPGAFFPLQRPAYRAIAWVTVGYES